MHVRCESKFSFTVYLKFLQRYIFIRHTNTNSDPNKKTNASVIVGKYVRNIFVTRGSGRLFVFAAVDEIRIQCIIFFPILCYCNIFLSIYYNLTHIKIVHTRFKTDRFNTIKFKKNSSRIMSWKKAVFPTFVKEDLR